MEKTALTGNTFSTGLVQKMFTTNIGLKDKLYFDYDMEITRYIFDDKRRFVASITDLIIETQALKIIGSTTDPRIAIPVVHLRDLF